MALKLLIAAGEIATGPGELPPGVRGLIDSADEILVVAPTLPGRLDWLASATDRARKRADERLRSVLGQLDEMNSVARGAVGSDDPLDALADFIREFGPDHVLIALRGGKGAGWQEQGLLDQIQKRFGLPMTVFSLPAT